MYLDRSMFSSLKSTFLLERGSISVLARRRRNDAREESVDCAQNSRSILEPWVKEIADLESSRRGIKIIGKVSKI